MLGAGVVVVAVADETVLGDAENRLSGLLVDREVAAGAADGALPWELDAVPVRIAGINERAVAVGADAVIGVA